MTPIINHNVKSIISSSIGYSLLHKKLNNFTFDNVENVEINQANKIELKPYISYWSGGYKKKPNDSVINLHKLCVFYLKKHFKEVHFITDSESIAEQYYLSICQRYYNQEIKMIFPDGWPNQVEAENQSYTHIMRAKDLYPEINNLIAFIVNRLRL